MSVVEVLRCNIAERHETPISYNKSDLVAQLATICGCPMALKVSCWIIQVMTHLSWLVSVKVLSMMEETILEEFTKTMRCDCLKCDLPCQIADSPFFKQQCSNLVLNSAATAATPLEASSSLLPKMAKQQLGRCVFPSRRRHTKLLGDSLFAQSCCRISHHANDQQITPFVTNQLWVSACLPWRSTRRAHSSPWLPNHMTVDGTLSRAVSRWHRTKSVFKTNNQSKFYNDWFHRHAIFRLSQRQQQKDKLINLDKGVKAKTHSSSSTRATRHLQTYFCISQTTRIGCAPWERMLCTSWEPSFWIDNGGACLNHIPRHLDGCVSSLPSPLECIIAYCSSSSSNKQQYPNHTQSAGVNKFAAPCCNQKKRQNNRSMYCFHHIMIWHSVHRPYRFRHCHVPNALPACLHFLFSCTHAKNNNDEPFWNMLLMSSSGEHLPFIILAL